MVIILISGDMGRTSYRNGTTGKIVLITTNSNERRILNMYPGMLSIREKTHESDDRVSV